MKTREFPEKCRVCLQTSLLLYKHHIKDTDVDKFSFITYRLALEPQVCTYFLNRSLPELLSVFPKQSKSLLKVFWEFMLITVIMASVSITSLKITKFKIIFFFSLKCSHSTPLAMGKETPDCWCCSYISRAKQMYSP